MAESTGSSTFEPNNRKILSPSASTRKQRGLTRRSREAARRRSPNGFEPRAKASELLLTLVRGVAEQPLGLDRLLERVELAAIGRPLSPRPTDGFGDQRACCCFWVTLNVWPGTRYLVGLRRAGANDDQHDELIQLGIGHPNLPSNVTVQMPTGDAAPVGSNSHVTVRARMSPAAALPRRCGTRQNSLAPRRTRWPRTWCKRDRRRKPAEA
jgi:hypothetical protein